MPSSQPSPPPITSSPRPPSQPHPLLTTSPCPLLTTPSQPAPLLRNLSPSSPYNLSQPLPPPSHNLPSPPPPPYYLSSLTVLFSPSSPYNLSPSPPHNLSQPLPPPFSQPPPPPTTSQVSPSSSPCPLLTTSHRPLLTPSPAVNPTWVEQSCARKMLLDEMPFTLEDKESEATLGFSVRDSLAKSRLKKVCFLSSKAFKTLQPVQKYYPFSVLKLCA